MTCNYRFRIAVGTRLTQNPRAELWRQQRAASRAYRRLRLYNRSPQLRPIRFFFKARANCVSDGGIFAFETM